MLSCAAQEMSDGSQLEVLMKAGIHPNYIETTITCACGTTYETRSTVATLRVAICAKCHPFFTGRQRLVDTAGRVEKFHRKYGTQPLTN